jgi:hypothetical protein
LLVSKGIIPAAIADKVDPVITWQIKKGSLFRHELMILDIIGTNKFQRDINIMNPSYIQRVFTPVRDFCVQDGMNFKLIPYKASIGQPVLFDKRENKYTYQSFTEESYDYFLNGYKDSDGQMHPLEWGNLNSDIYVDPVSVNMGTVQRQTFCIAARELLMKGDTVRARKMLENCDYFFPPKNFPYDKYSIIMVDLYYDVFGQEKATAVWDGIFHYYSQDLTYLSQYSATPKANGVKNALQESYQILYTLNQLAQRVLGDNDRAEQAKALLSQQGISI